ncbi:hypothetical protein E3N88_38250 [Mikania micrantha]|uniref:Uncharacterized protein n=1 Tax=Mikania micrantha TaxID=192012 RepID=A0A5N6LTG7_9ASTR|nr:hypothetical protein E3N88_38250 [Mikania micrantha]
MRLTIGALASSSRRTILQKDPIQSLIAFVYPSILQNFESSYFFRERAILAPTNKVVQEINERFLSLFPGDENEYRSFDSICQTEHFNYPLQENLYVPDVLNTIKDNVTVAYEKYVIGDGITFGRSRNPRVELPSRYAMLGKYLKFPKIFAVREALCGFWSRYAKNVAVEKSNLFHQISCRKLNVYIFELLRPPDEKLDHFIIKPP